MTTTPLPILRSILAVPASNPRMIAKSLTTDADAILFDLEDAVAPAEKTSARADLVETLAALPPTNKTICVRINAVDTPYFHRDVAVIAGQAGARLDVIVLPKALGPGDIAAVDRLLTSVELDAGRQTGGIRLHSIVETPAGLQNVDTLAAASPRLSGLVFGPGDFSAGMRMPAASIGSLEGDAYLGHRYHYPMSRVAVAARAAGIAPIDGPIADFRDLDLVRRSARIARSLGFEGKWCIHPNQIAIVNEVFTPTPDEIAWAEGIVTAWNAAAEQGAGAAAVDDKMIDLATLRMAESLLE